MPGSWVTPITAPFSVGVMLLLTDGSVLSQDSGTSFWWRLYPDRAGRYAQGEWRRTANSANAPLNFASAVLKDGRVLVAGGEYSNNGRVAADLGTAEVYDPTTHSWRSLSPPRTFASIGAAPCCVLDDGRVLLGNIRGGACWIWDPAKDEWSITAAKASASSKGESWALLPDGSVLTIGRPGPEVGAGSHSEVFLADAWVDAGVTPGPLAATACSRIGPAVLLVDGTVFAIGASGATARYTPAPDPGGPGRWTPGADTPPRAADGAMAMRADGVAACLLPNGRLLCAFRPTNGEEDDHPQGAVFREFDGSNPGAWTPADSSPGSRDATSGAITLLLLPSSEVLASNGTSRVQVYMPDGGADPAWAPAMEMWPDTLTSGGDYRLSGRRLNGLSQACAHGAGAAMATNYPIVRLRAPFPSDTLVYCRTHDHSTMAVATGRSVDSTGFSVPDNLKPGVWTLEVVANGIASVSRPVIVVARAADPQADGGTSSRAISAQGETFARSLSEVHLLLDFISGRADKSLADLTDISICDAEGKPVVVAAPCVVEEICKITYPPHGGLEAQAAQAAFILLVTDKLNHLAYPARGLTIAFTSMFSGVTTTFFSRLRSALGGWIRYRRDGRRADETAGSRRAMWVNASIAYPQYEARAASFRSWYDALPQWAALLLFLVIFLNWDVSVTTSDLGDIAAADKSYEELIRNSKLFLPSPENCRALGASGAVEQQVSCLQATRKLAELTDSRNDLDASLRERWYTPIGLSVYLFAPAGRHSSANTLENLAGSLVDSANTIIIPALFGWLGTLAGLVRSITAKVRDNVLAPRDYAVSRASIFLGVAAGLAVGLFIKTTGQNGGIIVPAGLSFLAGFGAEAFFGFLDGLLTRIFASQVAPGGNVSAGAAASPPR